MEQPPNKKFARMQTYNNPSQGGNGESLNEFFHLSVLILSLDLTKTIPYVDCGYLLWKQAGVSKLVSLQEKL